MPWVIAVFCMTAGACLTVALTHGLIWWRQRESWAHLLFALAAVGTVACAWCDLAMAQAQSPAEFSTAVRWIHVAVWLIVVPLAAFVRLYLHAGRPWLMWAFFGVRTFALIPDFLTGQNLNFRVITRLQEINFLGETVATPVGDPNPWVLVNQFSTLMLLVFVIDASISAWRNGDRQGPVVLGGSIVLCIVAATIQPVAIVWGHRPWPVTTSLFFLGIIVATCYELAGKVIRTEKLADELRVSRQQALLAAQAIQAHHSEISHLARTASLSGLSPSIAHEVNQPLTAILSNAQAGLLILKNDNVDLHVIREILRDIETDDRRASEIIHMVRALSKKADFQPRSLDANKLIEDVLKIMNHDLQSREVRLVSSLAADLPSIRGDWVQLQQVLINLILNAGDAMAQVDKGLRVITLRSAFIDGQGIDICVMDTGGGIAAGAEERIFEPYFTTKQQGLGLGLSLSREIVAAHEGRLWAENLAAGGAAFHLTIPPMIAHSPHDIAERSTLSTPLGSLAAPLSIRHLPKSVMRNSICSLLRIRADLKKGAVTYVKGRGPVSGGS
jgi:signal transduction histidine kinase